MTAAATQRVALKFVRDADGVEDGSLAALTRGEMKVDAHALVPWMLGLPPTTLHESPYRGISCRVDERDVADRIDPWPTTPSEAAKTMRRAIERAIERALGNATRVAVITGGGLDSGGLLALTVDICRRRGGSAFAVALDYEAKGDDRPHLVALAAHLGCEVLRVKPEDAGRWRHLLVGVDAAPFTMPNGAMEIELLTRAREHGAEVAVAGFGGDELFDGEPETLADVACEGRWMEALRAAREMADFGEEPHPAWRWVARPLITRWAPRRARLANARRRPPDVPAWAGPVMRAALAERWTQSVDEFDHVLRGDVVLERRPSEKWRVFNAWYRHQQELVAGIPRADPYFDRGLVAAVHRLPTSWLLYGNRRRGLFREAMRGVLPESVRTRPDKAYVEPAMNRWVASIGGFDTLRPLASATHLAAHGLVAEPHLVAKAFEELASSPVDSYEWSIVWPAMCVEALLRSRAGEIESSALG